MHIIDLKHQIKDMLIEFTKAVTTKQYFGVNINANDSLGYFSNLYPNVKNITGWVYVIFNADGQQCKIGHTCQDPVLRAKKIFSITEATPLYIAAFPVVGAKPWHVERFVQNMLYAGGLQAIDRKLGKVTAKSGGTEIFNIRPSVACALIEQTIESVCFT